MQKVVYKISGMHCKSCEILIEDKLKNSHHVEKINVNCKTGIAEIYYKDKEPNEQEIKKDLKVMGYDILEKINEEEFEKINKNSDNDDNKIFSKNKTDYTELLTAGIIFLTLYILFGLLKLDKLFAVNVSSSSVSWSTAILVGLTAGVSSCMALVGGLIMGVSTKFSEKHPNLTAKQKFIPHVFFNLGRILGFFMLGGVLGLVGSAFKISISLTGILTIGVGIFMLLLGAQLLNIFPFISKFKFTLPKSISRFFGITDEKQYSHKGTMLLGALTFFLPCGFTQAMQLYAVSSGGFFSGGIIMALFALGTAPGLLGVGGLTSFIKGKFSGIFFKVAGIAVVAFALFDLNNGYNLMLVGGFKINNVQNNQSACSVDSTSPACTLNNNNNNNNNTSSNITDNVTEVNGKQIIKIKVDSGYSPSTTNAKAGVPTQIEFDGGSGYDCSHGVNIPSIGYSGRVPTNSSIFTDLGNQAVGSVLSGTCSMGMYNFTINFN